MHAFMDVCMYVCMYIYKVSASLSLCLSFFLLLQSLEKRVALFLAPALAHTVFLLFFSLLLPPWILSILFLMMETFLLLFVQASLLLLLLLLLLHHHHHHHHCGGRKWHLKKLSGKCRALSSQAQQPNDNYEVNYFILFLLCIYVCVVRMYGT